MKRKITTKDPSEKVARQRLTVLQLAEALGNVSEACKRSGMDRTSYYAWKKRYTEQGLEGLKDLPPIVKNHPQKTDEATEKRLLELCLEHPGWGCTKLSDYLKLEGYRVSSPITQKILIRNNLGSRFQRALRVEEEHLKQGFPLDPEQIRLIEAANPCFAERHVESSQPGELLSQDTKLVGTISGIGRIYLHAVVDTYGSYAWGFLHTNKIPEAAATLLHNDVLPQFKAWGLPVQAILTDNGREYCGTDAHPYEIYLSLNDIEHRTTQVRRPQTNGFVERFMRTVKEEFIPQYFRRNLYTSVEAMQEHLDQWLHHYNYERPHRGYRNNGLRPAETVQKFSVQIPFPSIHFPNSTERKEG
jgi:transposase InsO family protein